MWIEGVEEPLVASRTERTILHDMGHEAGDSALLDGALDLAERLAVGRRGRSCRPGRPRPACATAACRHGPPGRERTALLRAPERSLESHRVWFGDLFSRSVHEVARELLGCTAPRRRSRRRRRRDRGLRAGRPGEPLVPRPDDAERGDVRPSRAPLCLPLVRDPLVRERRLRGGRGRGRSAPARARADRGARRHGRPARPRRSEAALRRSGTAHAGSRRDGRARRVGARPAAVRAAAARGGTGCRRRPARRDLERDRPAVALRGRRARRTSAVPDHELDDEPRRDRDARGLGSGAGRRRGRRRRWTRGCAACSRFSSRCTSAKLDPTKFGSSP